MPTFPARLLSALPRLAPSLVAAALALPLFTTQAQAHCTRHIYNNSSHVVTLRFPAQVYPNNHDFTLQPGESRYYQIVSGTHRNRVVLTRGGFTVRSPQRQTAEAWIDPCRITHSCNIHDHGFAQRIGWRYLEVQWNEPADGEITVTNGADPSRAGFTYAC